MSIIECFTSKTSFITTTILGACPAVSMILWAPTAIANNLQTDHLAASGVEPGDVSAETSSKAKSVDIQSPSRHKGGEQETIIVTGSHIRGINTTVGNQLITIDREEIERQSYATVRDLIEDLPQNFGGGATGERQINPVQVSNYGYGNTVNLRGLGPTATLSLVNGRRIPTTGVSADVPDISGIPLAAIERIEVLPDGASAVYGSDAVAGVVNFILKESYSGWETGARYGTATGTSYDEYQFNQSAGFVWDSGNVFLSYEFNKSDRLRRKDRFVTSVLDFRPYGGLDRRYPYGNPGNILSPSTFQIAYAIPKNQNGQSLTPDKLLGPEQATYIDLPEYMDTFPRQKRHSAYGYANQNIAPELSIFAEGRFSHREFDLRVVPQFTLLIVPEENPFYIDVFGDRSPLFIGYSFENEAPPRKDRGSSRDIGATLGADWQYAPRWSANAYFSYGQNKVHQISGPAISARLLNAALSNPNRDQAFNPFGHGQVNSPSLINSLLVDLEANINARVYQANITTSGDLLDIADGVIKTAIGAEYREEKFRQESMALADIMTASAKRKVFGVFGEIFIPIIGQENPMPWAQRLDLSFSARYERTKDSGGVRELTEASDGVDELIKRDPQSSTNPRIGVVYEPLAGILLRGNYGTSFRAPGLSALTQIPAVYTQPIRDPRDPSQQLYGLFVSGAQRDLENETADTWGLGLEFTPEITRIARIKLSYFSVIFRDQVGSPAANIEEAIVNPAYSNFVKFNPTLADIQSACSLAAGDLLQVGPGDCSVPGRIQFIYDMRSTNIAKTKVRGFDFDILLPIQTQDIGQFSLQAVATYILDYKLAPTDRSPYVEKVNTAAHPLTFRGRASVTWESPIGIIANGDVNYTNSYRNEVQGRKIDSWTTIDIGISYAFAQGKGGAVLEGSALSLTVNNIFNNTPPFYEDPVLLVGYDAANADPFGRKISLSFVKKW